MSTGMQQQLGQWPLTLIYCFGRQLGMTLVTALNVYTYDVLDDLHGIMHRETPCAVDHMTIPCTVADFCHQGSAE